MKSFVKIIICAVASVCILSAVPAFPAQPSGKAFTKGVWVTVFSTQKVLYSKTAANSLVDFCARKGITEIYLQLYRSGHAYYDSKICGRAKYDAMIKQAGSDPVEYLIGKAAPKGIKVFAWVNVLSLAQNRSCAIIDKYGEGVLTLDQLKRPSMRTDEPRAIDKYYMRDEQLFLEPGDPRVVRFSLDVVNEIVTRYPSLGGVHLDYVRYPYGIPYIPHAQFIEYGLSYGYAAENVSAFKAKTGFDAFDLDSDRKKGSLMAWDIWRRDRVTELVDSISGSVRKLSPGMKISAAVLPSIERAYGVSFQDWPLWLEEGILDSVILMNYTKDTRLFIENIRAALGNRGKGRIHVGVGVFILKENPDILRKQCEFTERSGADGVAYFAYDELLGQGTV